MYLLKGVYISWVYFINVYERLGLILFKTFPVQEVGWAWVWNVIERKMLLFSDILNTENSVPAGMELSLKDFYYVSRFHVFDYVSVIFITSSLSGKLRFTKTLKHWSSLWFLLCWPTSFLLWLLVV